jgi:hypothetical protein
MIKRGCGWVAHALLDASCVERIRETLCRCIELCKSELTSHTTLSPNLCRIATSPTPDEGCVGKLSHSYSVWSETEPRFNQAGEHHRSHTRHAVSASPPPTERMSCFEPRGDLNLNVSTSFLTSLPLTFDTHTLLKSESRPKEMKLFVTFRILQLY